MKLPEYLEPLISCGNFRFVRIEEEYGAFRYDASTNQTKYQAVQTVHIFMHEGDGAAVTAIVNVLNKIGLRWRIVDDGPHFVIKLLSEEVIYDG